MTDNDIDEKYRGKVYIQDYSKKPEIEGVEIFKLKNFAGEDGEFSEVLRLKDGEMELKPGFNLAQINRVKIFPNAVKAWHLHYDQDEFWYPLPSDYALIGLWDLREGSKTKGNTMRIPMGGGEGSLIFIPKGVAHGAANFSGKTAQIFYFMDQKFNLDSPDERRLPWDSLGAEFWQPERD
jgi:dTDP-4-dehydrorhamnose 3,5-epimerase